MNRKIIHAHITFPFYRPEAYSCAHYIPCYRQEDYSCEHLPFYRFIVLSFYRFFVLSFCRFVVSKFCKLVRLDR